MDCTMPGFPVHHPLPELAQTHVCWVGDAIQPSHPLSIIHACLSIVGVPIFLTWHYILASHWPAVRGPCRKALDFPLGNLGCFLLSPLTVWLWTNHFMAQGLLFLIVEMYCRLPPPSTLCYSSRLTYHREVSRGPRVLPQLLGWKRKRQRG